MKPHIVPRQKTMMKKTCASTKVKMLLRLPRRLAGGSSIFSSIMIVMIADTSSRVPDIVKAAVKSVLSENNHKQKFLCSRIHFGRTVTQTEVDTYPRRDETDASIKRLETSFSGRKTGFIRRTEEGSLAICRMLQD